MFFLLLSIALLAASLFHETSAEYSATWISQANDSVPPNDLGFSAISSIVLSGEESLLYLVGGEEANSSLSATSPEGGITPSNRLRVYNTVSTEWEYATMPIALVNPNLATTNGTLWVVGGLEVSDDGGFAQESNRVFRYSDNSWNESESFRVNSSSYGISVCSSRNTVYLFDGINHQSLDANNQTEANWAEEIDIPLFPGKQMESISSVCTSTYGYYADKRNFQGFWRVNLHKDNPETDKKLEWTFVYPENSSIPGEISTFDSMQGFGESILIFSKQHLYAYDIRNGSFTKLVTLTEELIRVSVAASFEDRRVFFAGGTNVAGGVYLRNWFAELRVNETRTYEGEVHSGCGA